MMSDKLLTLSRRAMMSGVILAARAISAFAEPVKVDFWTEFSAAPEKPVLDEIAADFNKANPEIQEVRTGFENTPYETTLKTSFAGGNAETVVGHHAGGLAALKTG